MKTLKLEVGKTYCSRKGSEVKIIKRNWGQHPFEGSDGEWYTESGKWSYDQESPNDLIEEVEELPETQHTFALVAEALTGRYTFAIPDGVKKVTVEQVGNRIVVEMVPEKEPKPGDVLVNEQGSVYIFQLVIHGNSHGYYARLRKDGLLSLGWVCNPGRPATPEEAQPLWDALEKAGKKWNAETMQVEDVPELDRILEWVEANIKDGYYNHEDVAEAIEAYLKHKEGEK